MTIQEGTRLCDLMKHGDLIRFNREMYQVCVECSACTNSQWCLKKDFVLGKRELLHDLYSMRGGEFDRYIGPEEIRIMP